MEGIMLEEITMAITQDIMEDFMATIIILYLFIQKVFMCQKQQLRVRQDYIY
jgi:hypothetical protein